MPAFVHKVTLFLIQFTRNSFEVIEILLIIVSDVVMYLLICALVSKNWIFVRKIENFFEKIEKRNELWSEPRQNWCVLLSHVKNKIPKVWWRYK